MTLPFENIRVLDFGQYIAGPATAMMLGDQGAEIIRIDPPGGARWKSPAMDTLNRRKKSIVLNLKKESDVEIARNLIASADVLIENFRPGVMDRLGLGPETAHVINPRLVYLSLPGFASEDGEMAHMQAWEAIIAAASGQFTDMGLNRVLMGIDPSFSPLTLASAYAAVLAAVSVSAALYARESTGHGDCIEVPIASALMEGLVLNSMFIEDKPKRYNSLRENEIERRQAKGEPLDISYDQLQAYMDPFYKSYFCADDRLVYVVNACHVDHCHRALDILGLREEVIEAGLPELDDWYLPSNKWPEGVDCALGLYPLTQKWADWVSGRMKQRFLGKTSFEWERLFGEAGVPLTAHRTTREWLHSTHALASGLVHEINDPVVGKKKAAGPVAWLSDAAEFAAKGAPAPRPDQDRIEILSKLEKQGPLLQEKTPLTQNGCWLEGTKILDMTNVIAGPTAAAMLVRFGAEVIKLDPVKPTFDPWNTVIIGMQVHRGKRSILADIKNEKGKELFLRLIKWADVITFNGTTRQLRSLGIDRESLESMSPGTILCQLNAWGGPRRGPRSEHVGYDDLVQAATGIMARFGGALDTPEEHAHLGTIDVLTGFSAAFAILTALFHKKRTGKTDVARASLSAAGQLLQIPFLYDYEGRAPFDEPSGPHARGDGPLYQCYEAADGWFFLAVDKRAVNRLETIEALRGISRKTVEELFDFLADTFKTRTVKHWVHQLCKADVGAAPMASMTGLREKYLSHAEMDVHARGGTFQFTRYADHPSGHTVDLFSSCAIRPQYARLVVPTPAEKYGKDTRQILVDLGYSNREIRNMIDAGMVSESWSEQYLPD